jgi:hypothetical protein
MIVALLCNFSTCSVVFCGYRILVWSLMRILAVSQGEPSRGYGVPLCCCWKAGLVSSCRPSHSGQLGVWVVLLTDVINECELLVRVLTEVKWHDWIPQDPNWCSKHCCIGSFVYISEAQMHGWWGQWSASYSKWPCGRYITIYSVLLLVIQFATF